ncbi:MAG: EAL domain-containing protein [Pseudomonadota bacterium]
MKQRVFGLLTFLLCLITALPVWAQDVLTLGVFAYRPKEILEKRYQPLADYLSEQLGNTRIEMRVLNQDEIERALANKELDLVFTNPSHYTQLRLQNSFTGALATLVSLESGHPTSFLGGVIATRPEVKGIDSIADLRGKTIAIPGKRFLGGYQTQAYELLKAGIHLPDDADLEDLGSHDAVVKALLAGKADIGFFRTGIIEELSLEGKLAPDQLRIINQQFPPNFPYVVSTRIYPEWAFVALPHVSNRIVRRLAGSLIVLEENHPAARAAGIGGFSPPGDYLPVENLARELRLPPFDQPPEITWSEVWQRWLPMWIALIVVIGSVLVLQLIRLTSRNRELVRLENERRRNEQQLRIAAAAFESHEAMLVTDAQKNIMQVNQAFTDITGFTAAEAVGKSPILLDSGRHDENFFACMWQNVDKAGSWQGEIWHRRKDGELFPVWHTISAVRDDQGAVTHYVCAFSDITQHKASEEEIRNLAFYDPLTQLPNRRLMLDRLHQAMLANERSGLHGALLFIDLDNFKTLNDTRGHSKGDLLLQQVAQRLLACVREGDTVSRLGGDEFVVILEKLSLHPDDAASQAQVVGEKILSALDRPYRLDDFDHLSTPSIGVALFSGERGESEDLMRRADMAMYEAKRAGRNTLRFYDPDMQARIATNNAFEAALLQGVIENQFLLHYQPQVDPDGRVVGAEALLRWEHPERGMVSPAHFIPLAEQSGLIVPIGFWVLREACNQLARWANNPHLLALTLSVNVSAKQFSLPTFVTEVKDLIEAYGINPARLKLELTESLLLENSDAVIAKMIELRALGVQFSLDDFGTGYSSLAYLKRLPLEQIKIDQSFVRDLENDENDAVICAATISLAHSMRYKVVAEGVETPAQRHFLTVVHHCDYMQGYLFSRPLPLEGFEAYASAPGVTPC